MEEGLNERNKEQLDAVPLPARGGPSLLVSRPAPAGELADPGQAG
ncbi:MAG TPA: hypothetical protein VFS70_08730 [Actinomycetota bacterium]|nr:hypothetical protein [Actinomycetota bacterium]